MARLPDLVAAAKPRNPLGTELFCGENGKQYSLDTMHGRFRHCKQYILNSLVAAGLSIRCIVKMSSYVCSIERE